MWTYTCRCVLIGRGVLIISEVSDYMEVSLLRSVLIREVQIDYVTNIKVFHYNNNNNNNIGVHIHRCMYNV